MNSSARTRANKAARLTTLMLTDTYTHTNIHMYTHMCTLPQLREVDVLHVCIYVYVCVCIGVSSIRVS